MSKFVNFLNRQFAVILSVVFIILIYYLIFTINSLRNDLQLLQAQLTASTSGKSSLSIEQPSSIMLHQQNQPKLQSMEEIGRRTETDKVLTHRYYYYYPRFLEPLRSLPNLNMLEIGFLFGQSYKMWKEYFPNGNVFFLDIVEGDSFPQARFKGDSGDPNVLSSLLDSKKIRGNLDVIVDDGSHYPPHQITAFSYLFLHGLKPGGIYIIEDIETSYWRSGLYIFSYFVSLFLSCSFAPIPVLMSVLTFSIIFFSVV
jgi:hypothetical protein